MNRYFFLFYVRKIYFLFTGTFYLCVCVCVIFEHMWKSNFKNSKKKGGKSTSHFHLYTRKCWEGFCLIITVIFILFFSYSFLSKIIRPFRFAFVSISTAYFHFRFHTTTSCYSSSSLYQILPFLSFVFSLSDRNTHKRSYFNELIAFKIYRPRHFAFFSSTWEKRKDYCKLKLK